MSSREPMWYCHECNAEMIPLMVPDPHCAECHGTFVEKIEDLTDDPREFRQVGPALGGPEGERGDDLAALDALFSSLLPGISNLARYTAASNHRAISPSRSGGGVRLEFRGGSPSGGNSRTLTFGGSNPLGSPRPSGSARSGVDRNQEQEQRTITGALMAQYLATLLGHPGDQSNPFAPFGMMTGMGEDGRMGDYVFSQEALDHIITQLMEGSNSSRPVAATEEAISKLQKDVLVEGCELLSKDCAVCKEQFKLETEDPDEQIIVTLPCHHPFHEGCIMPWLKSSGTCPVCRYQLVPQPEHPARGGGGPSGRAGPSRSRTPGSPRSPSSGEPGGFFSSLFGNGSRPSGSGSGTTHTRSGSHGGNGGNTHLPGRWEDEIDD